jgi:hypothetical protein
MAKRPDMPKSDDEWMDLPVHYGLGSVAQLNDRKPDGVLERRPIGFMHFEEKHDTPRPRRK